MSEKGSVELKGVTWFHIFKLNVQLNDRFNKLVVTIHTIPSTSLFMPQNTVVKKRAILQKKKKKLLTGLTLTVPTLALAYYIFMNTYFFIFLEFSTRALVEKRIGMFI